MAIAEGIVTDPNPQPPGDPKPAVQPQPDPKLADPSPAPGAGPKTGVDDPRIKGLTADLVKERKARQEFEKRFKDHDAQLTERNRQIAALTGTKTPTADEAEIEEVRQQFAKLFPGLAKLDDKQIEKLLKVAESSDTLSETTKHYWDRHARTTTDQLIADVSELIGGELSARQKNACVAAYSFEIENNPELAEKFEQGDVEHLKQFAKDWAEDWLTAAQRKVTATNVNRLRPVPRSGDRSVTTTAQKKIDFKDPKAVEDAMVKTFRDHGGSFGD
jgi:hypothetical protein